MHCNNFVHAGFNGVSGVSDVIIECVVHCEGKTTNAAYCEPPHRKHRNLGYNMHSVVPSSTKPTGSTPKNFVSAANAMFKFAVNSSKVKAVTLVKVAMEVAVRLYQPLKPVIATHSFLVGSYQGGESDELGTVLIHRGTVAQMQPDFAIDCCFDSLRAVHVTGKTTVRDLRKLIEETRKGTSNMRSRMFQDIIYFFNDAPNIHGKPESGRRKYRFGIVPKRAKDYDDTKIQDVQPVLVPFEGEPELFCDQLLTRYNEKLTVLVVQGVFGVLSWSCVRLQYHMLLCV